VLGDLSLSMIQHENADTSQRYHETSHLQPSCLDETKNMSQTPVGILNERKGLRQLDRANIDMICASARCTILFRISDAISVNKNGEDDVVNVDAQGQLWW
jgi:hypothetical protein